MIVDWGKKNVKTYLLTLETISEKDIAGCFSTLVNRGTYQNIS